MRQLEAQVRSGAMAGDRAELLGQRADAGLPSSASQRDRLLQSTGKLDKSGERIQQSRQIVAHMEVQASLNIPQALFTYEQLTEIHQCTCCCSIQSQCTGLRSLCRHCATCKWV